jgi:hypothetical protein
MKREEGLENKYHGAVAFESTYFSSALDSEVELGATRLTGSGVPFRAKRRPQRAQPQPTSP